MKKIVALLLLAALVTLSLCACSPKKVDSKTIIVAASSTPHAEILEQCVAAMAEKGYKLEIRVMGDYVIPNTATEEGEVTANYFQHKPYLDDFNAKNGTHLVSVASIHYEPYGIYAGKVKALADLPDGAKIAVPNDSTNEGRALQLLAANGLITLKEDAGLTATKRDIESNPHNYEIYEMEAALIPDSLDDVDIGVINGNYAIEHGLKVSEALAVEGKDSDAARLYANILVVKKGNEKNEGILALIEVMRSDNIRDFINRTYDKSVIPMF